MLKYVFKRLLLFIPVFLGITFLTFSLMKIAPSDPVEMYYFSHNEPLPEKEILEQKRKELGLDKSFLTQYKNWLIKFSKGDMGKSYADGEDVNKKIAGALPYTIKLAVISMLITVVVSTPLGILTASKRGKFVDVFVRMISFITSSIPSFILSILLMYLFAIKLKMLPVISFGSKKGIVLPALALSLTMSAKYIRQVRATVLEELGKDYVLGARSRGIKENVILYKNVLRNTMITIVTLIGLSMGSLLGGTAITENIFMWPGMGQLVIEAIEKRDYPTVQAFVVWMALIFVIINIIIDISYRLLDPRVKEKGE